MEPLTEAYAKAVKATREHHTRVDDSRTVIALWIAPWLGDDA
jgi:hypothetical protein